MSDRYDFAPLERRAAAVLRAAGRPVNDVQLGLVLRTDRAQVRRWRDYGVTADQADTLATRVGVEPYLLWPEILDAAIEDVRRECAAPDCTSTFVRPYKGWQKFCSPTCRRRVRMRRYREGNAEARARAREREKRYRREVREAARRRAERRAA